MVKIVRDFFLNGIDHDIFHLLKISIPKYLKEKTGDKCNILEEIVENKKLYRKSYIEQKSILQKIPNLIIDKIPSELTEQMTTLIEEAIFDQETLTIEWKIYHKDMYCIEGRTMFVQVDEEKCKVIVFVYLTVSDMKQQIPNKMIRLMVLPIIESKMPEMFVENLKIAYQEIIKTY